MGRQGKEGTGKMLDYPVEYAMNEKSRTAKGRHERDRRKFRKVIHIYCTSTIVVIVDRRRKGRCWED